MAKTSAGKLGCIERDLVTVYLANQAEVLAGEAQDVANPEAGVLGETL